MKRPSRNMPISTVIVAAIVVERLAPSERIDSEKSSLNCLIRSRTRSAALVARQPAVLERDHAAAHLVDHLAVVGDHQDRRTRAVDSVKQLHDPDRRVRVEVPGRLVADQERRVVDDRARDRDALLLAARELVRKRAHLVGEPDEREHLGHLAADVGRCSRPAP